MAVIEFYKVALQTRLPLSQLMKRNVEVYLYMPYLYNEKECAAIHVHMFMFTAYTHVHCIPVYKCVCTHVPACNILCSLSLFPKYYLHAYTWHVHTTGNIMKEL